ncbi:uncharacterized protein [Haliotis cracherodii]|uniref:uncharacterized protein n=1 Tax=Haliotis cracherodii TaxID=6455 RepID=UPI0039E8DEA9
MPSHVSTNGFYVLTSLPDKEEVWNQIYKTRSRSLVTWAQDNQTYLPSAESSVTTSRLTASMRSRTLIMDDVNVDTIDLVSKDNATFTVQHHHLTGSVRDHSGMALIDTLLALHRHPCTIVSRCMTETRLLVLLLNIASRIQDDGKVDIITNMRRLYTRLGGRPFTLTDVCFCLEFSKQRLGSL